MASKQDLKDKHELARLDKERERRNKNYLEFLDAVSKGEKRNYEQYRAHQRYVDKRDKEQAAAAKEQAEREAKIAKIRKQHIDQGKKSRDLARDHGKFLKSNTGVLLERLGIVSKESDFGQLALDAAKDGNLEAQKGLNVAGQLRKEAYAAIEMGTFDPISFENDLENSLNQLKDLDEDTKREMLDNGKAWAKATGETIEAAGGGEAFADQMEMSKGAMQDIQQYEDMAKKVQGFFTNSKFAMLVIAGAAIKFAKDLGTAFMELGVSFDSMPIAAGLAKEEATAMLEEFGTLEDITSRQLVQMKLMSKFYGVAAGDMAKIMMLQQSTTNLTKQQALDQQVKWMNELKDAGVSANKVFADMAANADFIALYTKGSGQNMKDAAQYSAQIGLDLGVASSMAEKLLDWESSIAAEMEASMILGRSINLDKARSLAYSGDIEAMMREVKNQAGGEAEFARMSVVQRQALGDAIGLQGAQLAEFMKTEEERTKALNTGLFKKMGLFAGIAAVLGVIIGAIIVGLKGMKGAADMGKGALLGGKIGLGAGALGGAVYHGVSTQGRASGGPVSAGSPYIVGERGSELFVPMTGGTIIPHAAGGAGPAIDNSEITSRMDKQFEQNERLFRKLGSQFEYGTGQH
jgi:hypothetical protein